MEEINKTTVDSIPSDREKAILVGIESLEELDELSQLLETAGGVEVGRLTQNIKKIDAAFFIGKGKLEELSKEIESKHADLIVFDKELSGAQIRNIEKLLNIRTIDRTQIILDIFAKRAFSKEGKLQVELAQLKYLLPRLTGQGSEMSRTGAGIGTRGPGEQKLEIDRRRIRNRIHVLQKEILKIKRYRNIQRKSRSNIYTICIVGYTNSGKSTLLNSLSNSNIFVEDQLFATLDPTTRKIELADGKNAIITDTVGFIRNLPHDLIDAFKSTLEEAIYADLLLHVVDGSNNNFEHQIDVVNNVLRDLRIYNKPTILIINKIDKTLKEVEFFHNGNRDEIVYVSAKNKVNLNELLKKIEYHARRDYKTIELIIPYNKTALISYLYEKGKILKKDYESDGIHIKGKFNPIVTTRIKKYMIIK